MLNHTNGQESFEEQMASVLRQFDPFVRGVAAVARGDEEYRPDIEEVLPKLEASGWELTAAVRRIWAGERDLASLMDGLDLQDSLIVKRILEVIERPSPEEVLASLPAEVRHAVETGDVAATNAALEELPSWEAQAIVRQLWQAGIVTEVTAGVDGQEEELTMPPAVLAALENEDVAALEEALAELPPDEANAIMDHLEEAGVIQTRQVRTDVDIDEVLHRFEPLLQTLAAIAVDDEQPTIDLEELLPQLEDSGWRLATAVQAIWDGERDSARLTAGVDSNSALVILRLLEIIEEMEQD